MESRLGKLCLNDTAFSRYLLYQALVDVRNLCLSRGPESWNPLEWRRQYRRSRVAGALGEWLHNLGFYAARDFRGFDADRFWQELDSSARRFREFRPGNYLDYRKYYARRLAEMDTQGDPDFRTG